MSSRFRRVGSPRKPARETGYIERVIEYGLQHIAPGEIVRIHIGHDDNCPRLRNRPCRCVPTIEAVRPLQGRHA